MGIDRPIISWTNEGILRTLTVAGSAQMYPRLGRHLEKINYRKFSKEFLPLGSDLCVDTWLDVSGGRVTSALFCSWLNLVIVVSLVWSVLLTTVSVWLSGTLIAAITVVNGISRLALLYCLRTELYPFYVRDVVKVNSQRTGIYVKIRLLTLKSSVCRGVGIWWSVSVKEWLVTTLLLMNEHVLTGRFVPSIYDYYPPFNLTTVTVQVGDDGHVRCT